MAWRRDGFPRYYRSEIDAIESNVLFDWRTMSAVSLTLHQTTSVTQNDNGASYQATNVVEAARGIEREVFVYRTDTKGFDHYATPADLATVPTSLELAVVERLPFYRQDSLTRKWPTLGLMQDDLAMTEARLRGLAREVSQRGAAAVIDKTVDIEVG
jgi:hypothetical protein